MRSGKKKYNCQKCNSSGHNTTTCTATTQAKGKAGAATAKYKKKQHKQGKYSCRRNRMKLQKKYGGADKFIVIDEFLIDCTRLLCM